ncbi:replication protein [Acinetobacter pollinis]|uniref:replication protein n=2 Tax=Acinetobacter pollinis TaxID=2605270 RepID=UPI0018C2A681|nr:replication protein [Acinetobacter pollinis]MBF7693982.1 replication protein [Acinetobacter pollinis]MBF7701637.1 replication protein [Acinetobacter pollinis]
MSFIPNSFQLPNAFVDEAMSRLSPTANMLYIVIVRKTRGWQKNEDAISLSQFEKITGLSRKTVIKALNELISYGFVEEYEQKNAKAPKSYSLNTSVFSTLVESPLVENLHPTSGEIPPVTSGKIPHTKTTTKTTNTKTIDICSEPAKKTRSVSEKSKKFSFEKSLLKLGANKQFVSEFMEVRKAKRAVDSETAFKRFISEQQKSGKSLDEVLELCIVNSWKSFNASWNQPPVAKQQPEAPKRRFGNRFTDQQPKPMRDVGGYHE